MVQADEEQRARQWRADQAKRCARQAARVGKLAGNPALRADLAQDWEPVTAWLNERRLPPDPECDEECMV